MGFTDRDGNPVDVPEPDPSWVYSQIGAFQGPAYHRNAFAQGTEQETAVLAQVLELSPGDRLLDVGCGNGRHVAAFVTRGIDAIGCDLSPQVLAGGPVAPVLAGDAARLPIRSRSVDAVISVCQGGFGISPDHDRQTVGEWYRVLRSGGRLALTAFSQVFAVRWMGEDDAFDAVTGRHHHLTEVRGPDGDRRRFDLLTTTYSPPHLRDLLAASGFDVLGMTGGEAGALRASGPPTVADPQILVWAQRG